MTIVASAPGKIVLSGEYAVLSGASAVCMAVGMRARATVSASPDGECHAITPGLAGNDPFAVIDAVCGGERQANTIELDTTAFLAEGAKIGIGSSAAVTVALTAALEDSTDVLARALRAHSALQGGRGSGIDVAAAVHGGLLEYEMSSRRIVAIDWPEGLEMRVLWSGVAASTEAKLNKLAAQAVHPSRSALGLAADRMAQTWRSGDVRSILDEYVAYISALRQFSVDHELGIFDAGHDELTDAAVHEKLIYKPAGAGGGDIGVLFGSDAADLDAFIADHKSLIHGVIPCDLDTDGVRLEPA